MRVNLHNIVLVLLCLICSNHILAKGFSYVYIQGDKSVPFYVKLEDQMLPRYGKNYNIIPQLAPGAINIQVLFQQNAYPVQKFTIQVPESGFRGFLLMKKGESFALYDIHQQFYLQPGNKAEDDKAPLSNTADAFVYKEPPAGNIGQVAVNKPSVASRRESNTPNFMGNVELNGARTVQSNSSPIVREQPAQEEEISYNTGNQSTNEMVDEPATGMGMVTNSDCPNAIGDRDFEDLYNKVADKSEKLKLKYLLSKMDDCYTSNQARILTEVLSNDPEKYTFLKRVYPRITDQYNFPAHENLLSTQEWKSYFRLILPK